MEDIKEISSYIGSVIKLHNSEKTPKLVLKEFFESNGTPTTWNTSGLERLVTQQGNWYGKNLETYSNNKNYAPDSWKIKGCYLSGKDIAFDDVHGLDVSVNDFPGLKRAQVEQAGLLLWTNSIKKEGLFSRPPDNMIDDLWYLDLLERIAEVNNMEPLVRLALTARVAKMHKDISWYPIESLKEVSELYKTTPKEQWPDPRELTEERIEAKELLNGFGVADIQRMKHGLEESFARLTIPPKYEYVGLVWFDENNHKAILLSEQNSANNQDIVALLQTGKDWRWQRVGEIKATKAIPTSEIGRIAVGTPLFVKTKQRIRK